MGLTSAAHTGTLTFYNVPKLYLAPTLALFFRPNQPPMTRTDSICLEFAAAGCSVVRSELAGVPCLTVAGDGHTLLVLLAPATDPGARKAADMWRSQLCYCTDRTTAHAIAKCLQSGEFSDT